MTTETDLKEYATSFTPISINIWVAGEENAQPYINLAQGNVGLVTSIQYHEDIFWPCYGATMILSDSAINLIAEMPIQGFEKVVMEFEDVVGERYFYEFRIWQISNRVNNDRKQQYTIGLISVEGLTNEGVHVNHKIEGNTSNQVRELLKKHLKVPDKLIDTEPSATSIKYLPTKESPFSLIRRMLPKTVSEKTGQNAIAKARAKAELKNTQDKKESDVLTKEAEKASGTAGYLFFQTRKSFVFKSIDHLVDSGEKFGGKKPVSDVFYFQQAKIGNPSMYRIQEIVFGSEINMIKQLREGSYSSLVSFFNINTGEYEERVYSLADMWKDMAHMGSLDKLPKGQDFLSEYPTRVMSSIVNHENWYMESKVASNEPKHGGNGDNQFPDWQKNFLQQGISRASTLFHQQLTISLTGHLELCAGDKIEIRIPNNKAETIKDEAWDTENSGTYLIKNLNHQFLMGANPTVYTVLELVRDCPGIKDRESKVK